MASETVVRLVSVQEKLSAKVERQRGRDDGGPGGYDGGMEHRITALETRLDTILPTLATKSDIGELRADFKGWTLTTALTIVGTMVAGFIGVATLMLRQPAPAPTQQAPIIINVPAPASPSPAK